MDVASTFSGAVFALSAGYLLWRFVTQWQRQSRSYEDLEFGPVIFDEHADYAVGAMVGVAVGDALGMPRESIPTWLARLRFGRKPKLSRGVFRLMRKRGTISDDTQLTAATARSITPIGYENHRFIDELKAWTTKAIGPGRATMKAADGWLAGEDRRDYESQGNGAAMRVVPLALAFDDLEVMIDAVRENAESTHNNPDAVAGAEAVARLVSDCLETEPGRRDWASIASPIVTAEDHARWNDYLSRATRADSLAEVGTSGWVFETVAAVVYLLERHGTEVDGALTELFEAGGDVDTIAAVYCACAGALGGISVFEPAWLGVQGAAELSEHATRLWDMRSRV